MPDRCSHGSQAATTSPGTAPSLCRGKAARSSTESSTGIGATIAGRKTYDDSGGWDGQLPFPWPFFIVTHRPPANARKLPFEFVTGGVARAVELAKSAAGDKDVSVMGGGIVCQLLEEGLLDEVRLDLVPILLGEGTRLLDRLHVGGIRLAQTRVVEAPGVTHLGFRVLR